MIIHAAGEEKPSKAFGFWVFVLAGRGGAVGSAGFSWKKDKETFLKLDIFFVDDFCF
ncbi:MAG: hypothetical protein HPY45_14315 [Anaerolineae bacterium]|nr:hypothetical protein [Anaerolineae bacterium]